MSSIGSGPLGIPPLTISLAGTSGQQKAADVNRVQQDAAVQKFQHDRAEQLERSVGDIGASEATDERDADGRMPWSFTPPRKDKDAASDKPTHHPPDLSQERGGQLDLDA